MSKPKKKRDKRYRPRAPAENAQFGGLVAIGMAYVRGEDAAPLRADQTADLGVAYWMALENLRAGSASEELWECIACALNVALVLSEKGIGAECEADLVRALDGVFRARVRVDQKKAGTFRLDGEALRDVKSALEVHDAQLEVATRAEVSSAMDTIRARLESGNVYQVGGRRSNSCCADTDPAQYFGCRSLPAETKNV